MKYEELDEVIVIKLPADVNVSESREFSNLFEFFLQKGFSKFVIDFSEVKFISSAFLSTLVSGKKRLLFSEGNLTLANVSNSIYRIFEITELSSFFDIFNSVEEAVEYLGRRF